jgi:ArsR family transcriptional regulator
MAPAVVTDHSRGASLFHALSDEIRLHVIELLRDGERCVCELTAEMGLAQPRLSWHLKTLKDAGIITDRRQGRWVYYTLSHDALEETEELLATLKPSRRRLPTRETGCC